MRKKGIAILLCSALLTLGAACTSYAAGWVQEGNNWTYQDNNGNKVKNGWAKGTADGLWRYLDANGNMAINCWVDDDTYYVDQNGIMATDKWLKVSADNYGNYKWYYLGSTGRMISEAWKKISDRYYYFDDEGVMQTGWLGDGGKIYYFVTLAVMAQCVLAGRMLYLMMKMRTRMMVVLSLMIVEIKNGFILILREDCINPMMIMERRESIIHGIVLITMERCRLAGVPWMAM